MHGDTHGKGTVAILGTMAALLISAVLFFGLEASGAASPMKESPQGVQLEKIYGRLPLYFIENRGQVDPEVRFYERGSGRTVWFTREGVWFSLRRLKGGQETAAQARRQRARRGLPERLHLTPPPSLGGRDWLTREVGSLVGKLLSPLPALTPKGGLEVPPPKEPEWETVVFRQIPVGMRKGVKVQSLDRQEHRVNYFIGSDPTKWHTDIPTYAGVIYEEAYRGIDLKFYGQGRRMEYDIVVKPGADPDQVRFQYAGVERLEVTPEGDLALYLPGGGALLQKKPHIYQEIAGVRVAREGRFRVHQDTVQPVFGFEVAAYDRKHPLVIDPVLVYSTYLGGGNSEFGRAIAVDGAGCAYVTGYTGSTNFPTQNPSQGDQGGDDAFVTKISAAGDALVYSTYLGGGLIDQGLGIAVDGAGCAYVTGWTTSINFPTQNAYQGDQGGWDAFVTKLSAAGNTLVYSTYLGGGSTDYGYGIAVDGAGCAYVTGWTESTNFPTQNAYQGDQVGVDAFVTKLSAGGNTLAYSTYLGGGSSDYGAAIAVDGAGCAYVTGVTNSTNFPTQSPCQGNTGLADAFVTKLSAGGNTLAYSTYLGGAGSDYGYGIAVDGAGCAYVTGNTNSGDFPTASSYQKNTKGGRDAFVTKLSAAGNVLVYSTYLGGGYDDGGQSISVDRAGCAYVTGWTESTNFPTKSAYQGDQGGWDAFVTKFTAGGKTLAYSTYLGGGSTDYGYGIAVDGAGCAYVTGETNSANFPTQNPYQGDQVGIDAFVTKLRLPHVPLELMLLLD
ncbi:MAG: SBBP repeat-containing protein [Desulfobacterales bacterium]|nr:SBBP repeat-containing protein [Desulfobacterales bacterium]